MMKTSTFALFLSLVLCSGNAVAEYPERAVSWVVPYAAGAGGGDRIARLITPKLAQQLKGTIVVENRAGADGAIGVNVVVNARPDGYTLLQGDTGPLAITPAIRKVGYSPAQLIPIGPIASLPQVLAVSPALGVKSLAALVELSQTRPGGLDFASGAAMGKVGIELLKRATGLKVTVVPFGGGSPAIQSVLAGQTALTLGVPTALKPFIQSGQLIAIAVAGAERSHMLPDVPTFAELGVRDVYIETTVGLYAPKGTTDATVAALNRALLAALDDPEIRQELVALGATSVPDRSQAMFARRSEAERKLWERVAAEAHLSEKD